MLVGSLAGRVLELLQVILFYSDLRALFLLLC